MVATVTVSSKRDITHGSFDLSKCYFGRMTYDYMANSFRLQDEQNSALSLATWESKMAALYCPLGIIHHVQQEKSVLFPYDKSFIDQACSLKMAGVCSISGHPILTLGQPPVFIHLDVKDTLLIEQKIQMSLVILILFDKKSCYVLIRLS